MVKTNKFVTKKELISYFSKFYQLHIQCIFYNPLDVYVRIVVFNKSRRHFLKIESFNKSLYTFSNLGLKNTLSLQKKIFLIFKKLVRLLLLLLLFLCFQIFLRNLFLYIIYFLFYFLFFCWKQTYPWLGIFKKIIIIIK